MAGRPAAALVVFLSLLGCRGESVPPETSGADASWLVAPEPYLVIGVLDGDPAYQFSDIVAAARRPDGGWVVVDAGSRTVRAYDSGGRLWRVLGSAGSGPGEFVRPTQVLSRQDGSTLVWDDATFRVTEFDPDGELADIRSFSRDGIAKAVEPPLYPASGTLLSDGGLIVRLIFKTADAPPGRFRHQTSALRVSSDQSAIDTVLFFRDTEQVSVQLPKGSLPVIPPLARRASIAVQPNEARLCIGDQAGPEVSCFGPDGAPVVARWDGEQVPATANEPAVTAWRDSMTDLYAQKMSRADADKILSQVSAPTEHPPYTELVLDRGGHLWVKTGTAVRPDRDTYLVFTPAGQAVGPVSVPHVRILEIGDDYLVGVARDELEVQYLKAFAIAKPS
ncbi:MAG: hypothetical protein HKP01_05585 [Gemmatimonadetes bacterium]|nr:hypothetical protein [Gemmatimonadota bacterium]